MTAAVARLVQALQGIPPGNVPAMLLERTLGNVRMLERLYPTADQLSAIEAFGRFLQRAGTSDIDPTVYAGHAKTIEQIRNQLAQVPPAAPKQVPAYALDEDDDD